MEGFGAAFRFTFLRAVREPALFIVLGASILLLVVAPAGTALGFHEEESLIRDIGLSTLLVSGILIALCTGGVQGEAGAAAQLLALRPVGRGVLYAGTAAGALLALVIANTAVLLCGYVILRHRVLAFADWPAYLMAGGILLVSILWGAYRNFRSGGSFVTAAIMAASALSAPAALAAAVWAPEGGVRSTLPAEDVMLLQTEVLCLSISIAVFATVWAGAAIGGRAGGLIAGWVVVVTGVVRENLPGIPPFLRAPLEVLVPNISLVWGGDLFYADVVTLPWSFVGWGTLYMSLWAAGILLAGLGAAAFPSSRGLAFRSR